MYTNGTYICDVDTDFGYGQVDKEQEPNIEEEFDRTLVFVILLAFS